MDADKSFLCIRCRGAGHRTANCQLKSVKGKDVKQAFDPFSDEKLLATLPSDPSSLCQRCAKYEILDAFNQEHILDVSQPWKNPQRLEPDLGGLNSIVLRSGCPLCRLIFRVLPRIVEGNDEGDPIYYLSPFPSYERHVSSMLKEASENDRKQYSIYFSVQSQTREIEISTKYLADPSGLIGNRHYLAFTLSSENPAPTRRALAGRLTGPLVDYALLRRWIKRCQTSHGPACQRPKVFDLPFSRMIDVQARCVVSYPPGHDYVALSYVWGDVSPKAGDLERRQLPQTIEDAITVTAKIGIKYLWVSEICHLIF